MGNNSSTPKPTIAEGHTTSPALAKTPDAYTTVTELHIVEHIIQIPSATFTSAIPTANSFDSLFDMKKVSYITVSDQYPPASYDDINMSKYSPDVTITPAEDLSKEAAYGLSTGHARQGQIASLATSAPFVSLTSIDSHKELVTPDPKFFPATPRMWKGFEGNVSALMEKMAFKNKLLPHVPDWIWEMVNQGMILLGELVIGLGIALGAVVVAAWFGWQMEWFWWVLLGVSVAVGLMGAEVLKGWGGGGGRHDEL